MFVKSLCVIVAALVIAPLSSARFISWEGSEIKSRTALRAFTMDAYKTWVSASIDGFKSTLENSRNEVLAMEEKSNSMKGLELKLNELLNDIANVKNYTDEEYFLNISVLFVRVLMLPLQYMFGVSAEMELLNRNGWGAAAEVYRVQMETFMDKFSSAVEQYINHLGPVERLLESDLIDASNKYRNACKMGKNQQIQAFPTFLKDSNLLGKA